MKKIWNVLPLIFFIYLTNAFAESPRIKTFYYYAQGGESLRDLLESQAELNEYVLDDLGYMQKISSWNRSISNQQSLKKGEQIYVEIPYDYYAVKKIKKKKVAKAKPKKESSSAIIPVPSLALSGPKITAPPVCRMPSSLDGLSAEEASLLSRLNDKAKKLKGKLSDRLETFADFLRIFKVSSYYSISRNIFEESVINSRVTTSTNQDSPFTVGGSFDWQWDPNISFAGDMYVSKMDEAISQTNKPMKLPFYYGATMKMGFKRTFWPFTMYGGLEHDSFASFNSDEVVVGSDIDIRTHNITGLGVGAKKEMNLFGKDFLFQGFYSQTVLSSQSRPSTVRSDPFKGSKFSIEGRMMYGGDWFYHAYYKQLDLKGATVLHIARFGMGFGLYF